MSGAPTMSELRARVHKERHREIGNVLARYWARPTAVWGTWLALRMGLSANQVTLLSLGANLLGAACIGTGIRGLFVGGVGLLLVGFWLDHVDGQVARWRGTASLDGVYLDYLLHHTSNLSLGFALGFGLMLGHGAIAWTGAGFAIACGWTLLSLHNDCRYKAFFQRLKSTNATYRVVGGAGGAPSPPAPWPRRGLGMFTWPAYKLCEGHVVLITLMMLAAVAALLPRWWLASWAVYVVLMSIVAPLLAAARIARAIAAHAAEAEFARWFVPAEAPLDAAAPRQQSNA
jgi:hypothetical protein